MIGKSSLIFSNGWKTFSRKVAGVSAPPSTLCRWSGSLLVLALALTLAVFPSRAFSENAAKAPPQETASSPPQEATEFQNEVKEIRRQRDAAHDALKESGTGTEAKHKAIDDAALKKARKVEAKRTKALKKLSEQSGVKIKQGSKGTKPSEGRGGLSDVDSPSYSGKEFDKIEKTVKKAGYTVKKRGDTLYIEELDTTIHRGESPHKSPTGSSAAEAEFARGYGKETSRSIKSGDKAVEVMDNLGKSGHTMNKPTSQMTSDDWQELGKMTGRNMKSAGVQNQDLADKCRKLKAGYRPESIGIDDLEGFQQQCKQANTEAAKKVRTDVKVKETRLERKLEQAQKDLQKAKQSGNKKKIRKASQKAKRTQQELKDTRQAQKAAEDSLKKSQPKEAKKILEETAPPDDVASDVDGPGKQKSAKKSVADADGLGTTDPDGPGTKRSPKKTTQKTVVDADGPGVTDVDGPGAKSSGKPKSTKYTGKGSGTVDPNKATKGLQKPETLKGKAGRLAGEYADGAVILTQAGKLREAIKEGDAKKGLEALGGQDIANRSDVEGAKDHADARGAEADAVSSEAEAAAVGKLKRMGATKDEIEEYRKNYGTEKGSEIVSQVKARGGKDEKGHKPLEGMSAEEDSWTAWEQGKEGVDQAGSYGKTIADGISLGNVSRREKALADLDDSVKQSGYVQSQTEEAVKSRLYTELRDRGATQDEAKSAVDGYFKDKSGVQDLVKELKRRDPEKAKGSGRDKDGLAVDNVDIEEDGEGAVERAKKTFSDAGEAMKEVLIDKPIEFVNDTAKDFADGANDAMEVMGIGSEKNEQELYAGIKNKEAADQRDTKMQKLINLGATPDEAKAAVDGKHRDVAKLTKQLHEKKAEKVKVEKRQAEKRKAAKAEKEKKQQEGDAARKRLIKRIWDSKQDAPEKEPAEKKAWADMTSGERREALKNNESDAWENVKADLFGTGKGDGTLIGKIADNKAAKSQKNADDAYVSMENTTEIQKGSTAGNEDLRSAGRTVDKGGAEAQVTTETSTRETAQSDRDNSWGTKIADSVQEGIETGAKTAAETIGTAAADKASSKIFKDDTQDENESDGDGSGEGDGEGSEDGEAVAGGGVGGGGGGGSGGGGAKSGGGGGGGAPQDPTQGAYNAGYTLGKKIRDGTVPASQIRAEMRAKYGAIKDPKRKAAFKNGYAAGSSGAASTPPKAASTASTATSSSSGSKSTGTKTTGGTASSGKLQPHCIRCGYTTVKYEGDRGYRCNKCGGLVVNWADPNKGKTTTASTGKKVKSALPNCPQCGSDDVFATDLYRDGALLYRYTCTECGVRWK